MRLQPHKPIAFCFVFLILASCRLSAYSVELGIYERGQLERENGNWEQALNIWVTALDSLPETTLADPRIGIAYIELATARQAEQFYEKASALYVWGLSRPDLTRFKQVVSGEMERLAPIVDKRQFQAWRKLLGAGDQKLSSEIKAFWAQRDPVPTSEVNERLIEHWERIALGRKLFAEAKNTVYSTDDRGLVFVKYGSPDERYAGKLGIDQFEMMRWFDDFLLRQEIQRFNQTPEYEVWRYLNLDGSESSVFLFGMKFGIGKYGLRDGIEQFIPDRAFRRSSTHMTRGVLPGAVLQLVYYYELQRADQFYLERFREIEAQWVSARAAGRLAPDKESVLGALNHYRSVDRDRANFKYLPLDRATTFDELDELYLNYKAFRYLDKEKQPRLNLVVVSGNKTTDPNFATPFFKPATKTKLKHRHVLLSYDDEWNRGGREIEYPDVLNYNTSVFNFSHNSSGSRFSLTAEKVLLDVRKSELEVADLPDTAKVLGVQSSFLTEIMPLAADSQMFEVSDLIVGRGAPEELTHWLAYPFPVITSDPVKSDSVQIYFQLYNMKMKHGGTAAVQMEFEIKAVKRRGKIDKKKESLKAIFDFVFHTRDAEKAISLDISKLKPGNYELTVQVQDRSSRQKKARKNAFRIAG